MNERESKRTKLTVKLIMREMDIGETTAKVILKDIKSENDTNYVVLAHLDSYLGIQIVGNG